MIKLIGDWHLKGNLPYIIILKRYYTIINPENREDISD
jgi:hypothetical protein